MSEICHTGKNNAVSLWTVIQVVVGRANCLTGPGKAYKIPRTLLKDCSAKAKLKLAGGYFLFGRSDEAGKPLTHIGEAENVFDRLCQHLGGKDFRNEVITFICKDRNLNKAHVKYLENRFHELALGAKRYDLMNGNGVTSAASLPDDL